MPPAGPIPLIFVALTEPAPERWCFQRSVDDRPLRQECIVADITTCELLLTDCLFVVPNSRPSFQFPRLVPGSALHTSVTWCVASGCLLLTAVLVTFTARRKTRWPGKSNNPLSLCEICINSIEKNKSKAVAEIRVTNVLDKGICSFAFRACVPFTSPACPARPDQHFPFCFCFCFLFSFLFVFVAQTLSKSSRCGCVSILS